MNFYALIVGALGLGIFLMLSPRLKVCVSIFVMTQCFDLVPRHIFNKDIWDFGTALLVLTWWHLLLLEKKVTIRFDRNVKLLIGFIAWMSCSFLWSVFIYEYPLIDTVKASRHLIFGYLSFFVFLRLRMVDPAGFEFVQKALYVVTYLLLPVCILQYVINKPLFSGLVVNYEEVLRGLPVFLPFCLLYFWLILSGLLAGREVRWHELIYAGMTMIVTALTFTRGIYLAVTGVFLLMLWLLAKDGEIRLGSFVLQTTIAAACLVGLFLLGALDRVATRFSSGIDILLAGQPTKDGTDVDTFSGRLALVEERFALVARHNPLVGYGFIHENNVSPEFRSRLKHASIIQTPEYKERYRYGHPYVPALLSVDIGWADIVVKTGLIGFMVFVMFLLSMCLSYAKNRPWDPAHYHVRLACYLQMVFSVLTMFNGNPLVDHVQIPMVFFSSFVIYSQEEELAPVDAASASADAYHENTLDYHPVV
jgi:hypothetical protein